MVIINLKDKKLKQLYKEAIGRRGWWEMPLLLFSVISNILLDNP